MPLVHAFLRIQQSTKDDSTSEVVSHYQAGDSFQSEMQLLMTCPNAVQQIWHSDNARGGLTIIIPLVDVTLEHGPTQLLPGTHMLTAASDRGFALWFADMKRGLQDTFTAGKIPDERWDIQPAPIDYDIDDAGNVVADGQNRTIIPAGSAVVFDARMLHRGLVNTSRPHNACSLILWVGVQTCTLCLIHFCGSDVRPALVYRYDTKASPPPGQGVIMTLFLKKLAQQIASVVSSNSG